MLPFFWYLLKVMICSGILFGYYWFFLRNKIFHQYNRFYLLAAMSLSLILPLLKINFWQPASQQNQAIRVLRAVSDGDEYMSNIVITAQKTSWSLEQLYPVIYLLVSFIFLFIMLRTLYLIRTLLKTYPVQRLDEVSFVNTHDDSTPFSFFKYIFWNSSIDIDTTTGRQIFKHEVAHIQEKHTYDKLFVNIVLIFCWCNPFFWLYRKELNMIHEFIADKKAVEDSDTSAFAAMILQAAYPKHRFELTNNFFYSPIKRRLLMLTKIDNPKISYIARLMVLPLAVLIFAAFTFKAKNNEHLYNGKKITVVIDAGHGGKDAGAKSADGIFEKDLTLALAKKIKELNTNESVDIVLTREDDIYHSPQQKAEITEKRKADLFISIHIGGTAKPDTKTGIEVCVAKDEFENAEKSKGLASSLIKAFENNFPLPVTSLPLQREKGIWVVQANNIPSVLIEAGYITNQKDVAYLKTESAKETIAKNVLTAIEKFANAEMGHISFQPQILIRDTVPSVMFINTKYSDTSYSKTEEFKTKALVIVDSKEIGYVGNNYVEKNKERYSTYVVYNPTEAKKVFGIKGKYGVIKLTQNDAKLISANGIMYDKESQIIKLSGTWSPVKGDLSNSLIYLEDKIISPEELNNIPPEKISSVNVLIGDKVNDIVDAKGKTSVIYVSLKADDLPEVLIKSDLKQRERTEPKLNEEITIKTTYTDKNNNSIFYIGLNNHLKVSTSTIDPNDLRVTISEGASLSGNNGDYIVQVRTTGKKTLRFLRRDGTTIPVSFIINAQRLPDPSDPDFPPQLKEKLVYDQQKKNNPDLTEITVDGKKLTDQELAAMKQKIRIDQQNSAKADELAARTVTGKKISEQELAALKQKTELDQQNRSKADELAERTVTGKKLSDQEITALKQKIQLEQQENAEVANKERAVTGRKLQELDLQAEKQKLLLEELSKNKNIVFTKAEQSPQFTGGEDAWRKYLVANLKPNTPLNEGWKAGVYKVMVKFIVHTDGTVSDVTTENYKGTKTAQHCIDVIKNAPRWQPA